MGVHRNRNWLADHHDSNYRWAGSSSEEAPQEHWPGPFATARQLVRQRDAAAAARQERLSGQVVMENEMEGLRAVEVKWTPKKSSKTKKGAEVSS